MKGGPNPKIFLVLTVTTLLVGSGLTYMQYGGYTEATAEVEKLKKEAKNQEDVERELQAAIDRLNETRGKLVHLEQSVAETAYVPTMLKELEKLGTECGIQVTGVRPIPRQIVKPTNVKDENGETTKKARKPYNELDIEVKGRGNYKAVLKFITGLTTFPKIVAARTVSLQPKVDSRIGGKPSLDCTIELRSYLFPADGSTPKAADSEETKTGSTINLSGRNKLEGN